MIKELNNKNCKFMYILRKDFDIIEKPLYFTFRWILGYIKYLILKKEKKTNNVKYRNNRKWKIHFWVRNLGKILLISA